MTVYAPTHQVWHGLIPVPCRCDPSYSERKMVDDRCYLHRLIDAVESLREVGWTVDPPAGGVS